MRLYCIMLFIGIACADKVFYVQSTSGCGLSYREAHQKCKQQGAHLATVSEVGAFYGINSSLCGTCGWTLDKTPSCKIPATAALCKPRCEQNHGGFYDAWCYQGKHAGNCSSALGLELNENALQLRASSERKTIFWRQLVSGTSLWSAKIARLNNRENVNAWIPENHQEGEYLEVEFDDLTALTGLVTQGASRFNTKMWVTKYKVKYSGNGDRYRTIMEEDNEKIFIGNVDNNGLKRNMFPNPVLARHIRIFPTEYHKRIAMRIEVLGCNMDVYNKG